MLAACWQRGRSGLAHPRANFKELKEPRCRADQLFAGWVDANEPGGERFFNAQQWWLGAAQRWLPGASQW